MSAHLKPTICCASRVELCLLREEGGTVRTMERMMRAGEGSQKSKNEFISHRVWQFITL